jgi:hypothetical protein
MKPKAGDMVTIKELYMGAYGLIDGDATFIRYLNDGKHFVIETVYGKQMTIANERLLVVCV